MNIYVAMFSKFHEMYGISSTAKLLAAVFIVYE